MKKTHDVILETLKAEAEEKSQQFTHENEYLQSALRQAFETGYMAGGSSILQKELADRLMDKIDEKKQKKAHKTHLKTAYKKVPAKASVKVP